MRERGGNAGVAGQHDGGVLEVGDVEKACGSARKMSCVGVALQDNSSNGVWGVESGGGGGGGCTHVRAWDQRSTTRDSVEDGGEAQASLMQKRRVELAPIVTAQSGVSGLTMASGEGEMAVLSSFTPLFRRLQDELAGGGARESASVCLDGWERGDGQQRGVEVSEGETDVSAVQRAMHEFNVRRLEMQGKKMQYEDAVWRFEEARWRMESVREGMK